MTRESYTISLIEIAGKVGDWYKLVFLRTGFVEWVSKDEFKQKNFVFDPKVRILCPADDVALKAEKNFQLAPVTLQE